MKLLKGYVYQKVILYQERSRIQEYSTGKLFSRDSIHVVNLYHLIFADAHDH